MINKKISLEIYKSIILQLQNKTLFAELYQLLSQLQYLENIKNEFVPSF
jgi:hypothetical protein